MAFNNRQCADGVLDGKSQGINAGNSQLSNKIRTSIEVLLTDIIFWELKHRGHVKCNNDSESAVMKGVVHGR